MKTLAVIDHSAHGHTEHIASHIGQGAASVAGTQVPVLKASELAGAPETLLQYDGLLLGSPTYLGGVRRTQQLKGKLGPVIRSCRSSMPACLMRKRPTT